MMLCGISCMFTPVLTFLQAGYFLVILLLIYGIAGIMRAITSKQYSADFVFSMISVIMGLIVMFVPGMALMMDGVLLYMMAGWFILQGIVSLIFSIKFKGLEGGKKWILGLIIGIIGILLGFYSIFHPLLLAFTEGILIGVYFIESGINMIAFPPMNNQ